MDNSKESTSVPDKSNLRRRGKKFGSLSLKAIATKSSGYCSSKEDIENSPTSPTTAPLNKRQNSCSPPTVDKRKKIETNTFEDLFNDNENFQDTFDFVDLTQQLIKNSNKETVLSENKTADTATSKNKIINVSGIGVLQDTLDNFEVNTQNENNNEDIGAFNNFLDEEREDKLIKKKLFPSQEKNITVSKDKASPTFSQLLNDPDVIKQIDSVIESQNESSEINLINEVKSDAVETPEQVSGLTQLFDDSQVISQMNRAFESESVSYVGDNEFKLPKLLSTYQKLKSIKNGSTSHDKTQLFNDPNVTDQYRHEVDDLFDQIEHSICIMGTDEFEKSKSIPDEVLDVIFSDENNPENNSLEKSVSPDGKFDWSNESLTAGFNASFGTSVRNTLLHNSTKSTNTHVPFSNLNSTIKDDKPVFHNLGPYYGLPLKVKELIKQYKGIDELYDWQNECLNLPAIKDKKNLIYALPTSGGKTLVAEILILRELLCYRKNVIFILPFVAIVQEKVWSLSPFAVGLDFMVEEYASSKGSYPPRKRRRKNSVYIATIEKALGLVNSLIENGRLNELGLIIVDELHLVGEEGRGPTLESVLTKLMLLKANIQIVGMSATIGNLQEICKFLNADVYTKDFRPVELTEYVKCGNEIAKVNWNYTKAEELLIEPKKVDFKYSESLLNLDPDMLGGLVSDVVPKSSVLIFCASKKNCENVALLLCKTASPKMKEYMKKEREQIIHALKDESGELCGVLNTSVQFGIAYHHSGLTSDERRIIEDGFRAGVLCIICCTSTLAAGVNLPARRVILRSPYVGREFISLSKYKQMVGRAGRAGLGEIGDSILLTTSQDLEKVKNLLMSPMNQALSGMHLDDEKGLRHLLLSCVSLGLANTRIELLEVTKITLLAVQSEKLEVSIKTITDNVIKTLFKLGAIEEFVKPSTTARLPSLDVTVKLDNSSVNIAESEPSTSTEKKKKTIVVKNSTQFVVSKMGSAAIKGGMDLSRAHLLYEDLYQAQNSLVLLDCLHLLYLVTPYETAEQIKPNMQVYYDIFTHLDPSQMQTAKILGFNESVAVKMISGLPIKVIPQRVVNRFYVTLMLYDLWNEMPVFQVSEKYQVNRGIVQNLMVVSATFASNVVNFCQELEEFWAFSHLLQGMSQRLSHCCVKELLPLMELPAVKQGRARQLYNAGYKTLQSIAKANANDLMDNIEFLSRRVANQLISASKMILLERVENLREEAEDVLDGVDQPKKILFNQTLAH